MSHFIFKKKQVMCITTPVVFKTGKTLIVRLLLKMGNVSNPTVTDEQSVMMPIITENEHVLFYDKILLHDK